MAHVRINAEGCKACLLCIEFCPRKCLAVGEELNSRGFHPAVLRDADQCTGCRVCALVCPDVCIEVFREGKPAGSREEHGARPVRVKDDR